MRLHPNLLQRLLACKEKGVDVEDPHPSRISLRKGAKYLALDWENGHWYIFKIDGSDISHAQRQDKDITDAYITELAEWIVS